MARNIRHNLALRLVRRIAAALFVAAAVLAACGGDGGADSQPDTPSPAPTTQSATPPPPSATPQPSATAMPVEEGAYAVRPVLPWVDFDRMLAMEAIRGDQGFALVLSQPGIVQRVSIDARSPQTSVFMDIRDRVNDAGREEGLLGVAFPPDFETSRRFYLYYTAANPRRGVLSRFIAGDTTADPASEQVLLEVQEPFSNHNGGSLMFGPDGFLYLGLGDGGAGGDPQDNGQNTETLLATILRLDVSGDGYVAPPDNPFVGQPGRDEIWAYGLRNPWRATFDVETGELWAGDVGQNKWEEVDRIVKGGNYGWNVMEGFHCFEPAEGCDQSGLILPRAEYSHDDGCSVTGGYVYRGDAMPELRGWYVYADLCSGHVWAVDTTSNAPPVLLTTTDTQTTSFTQLPDRELYLVTFNNEILRLERQ